MSYEDALHIDGPTLSKDFLGNTYIVLAMEAKSDDKAADACFLARSFQGLLSEKCKESHLIVWRKRPSIEIDGDKMVIWARLFAYPPINADEYSGNHENKP